MLYGSDAKYREDIQKDTKYRGRHKFKGGVTRLLWKLIENVSS